MNKDLEQMISCETRALRRKLGSRTNRRQGTKSQGKPSPRTRLAELKEELRTTLRKS